jgi:putative transposase
MYLWRMLTDSQRQELLAFRRFQNRPWHSPPHRITESGRYLLTSACFEHQPIIGSNPHRMADFSEALLKMLTPFCEEVNAWCVLANHYHVVVLTYRLPDLLAETGRFHGRTSFKWNGEDAARGRKVWFNCVETAMKSERHFYATVNYVHHNAVHHGYVRLWSEWSSSAAAFLDHVGRQKAVSMWKEYPVLDYGKDWDPADL